MEGKVTIVNTVNARVGITLPDIHFSHTWLKKGDKFSVSHDIFDAMMYDTGSRNMFGSHNLLDSTQYVVLQLTAQSISCACGHSPPRASCRHSPSAEESASLRRCASSAPRQFLLLCPH